MIAASTWLFSVVATDLIDFILMSFEALAQTHQLLISQLTW